MILMDLEKRHVVEIEPATDPGFSIQVFARFRGTKNNPHSFLSEKWRSHSVFRGQNVRIEAIKPFVQGWGTSLCLVLSEAKSTPP
jgi:hypothetical protein